MLLGCLLLAFAFLFPFTNAASTCVVCASPSLQTNWYATSLPVIPTGLTFTSNCANPSAHLDELKKTGCSGTCMEMYLVIGNKMEVVRGCHGDFMGTLVQNGSISGVQQCSYGRPVPDPVGTVIYTESSAEATCKNAQNLVRFCTTESNQGCNGALRPSMACDPDTFKDDYEMYGCAVPTAKSCVSCSKPGSGGCSRKTKSPICSAGYCTKFAGHVNGDYVVSRGCSNISPFLGDGCVYYEEGSLNLTFAAAVPRTKRSTLSLKYKMNHCFCSSESLCNSAPTQTTVGVVLFASSAAVFLRYLS